MPISEAVIGRVRSLRKGRGLTAKELAQIMTDCGYPTTRTAIAQAECGYRKEISVDWLWSASQALRVPVNKVLFGPDCATCDDNPPVGFTCNSCGTENI